MRVIQLCGSLGQRCGIARYASYVADALTSIGVQNEVVRTCSQLQSLALQDNGTKKLIVLVQHEYGLYDYLSHLSSNDSTGNIVSCLHTLVEKQLISAAAFIMHTIVTNDHVLNFANKQIFSSSFPIYHLNRLGSQIVGTEFLEHGVIRMPGSNIDDLLTGKVTVNDFAAKQFPNKALGSFGLLSPNKLPKRIVEIAGKYGLTFVGNFASSSEPDKQKLQSYLASSAVSSDVGFDFLPETEILDRLKSVGFVGSFQEDFSHYATTGSARFLLNFGVPLILNSAMPFADLKDVGVYVDDGYSNALDALLTDQNAYAAKVNDVVNFCSNNTMDEVYRRLLEDVEYAFNANRQTLQRHFYYHEGMISPPTVTHALHFGQMEDPSLSVENVARIVDRNFCAVPPIRVRSNFLDLAQPILSKKLLQVDHSEIAETWQKSAHSDFQVARQSLQDKRRSPSAGQMISLSQLKTIPALLWADYFRDVLYVDDTAILATIGDIDPSVGFEVRRNILESLLYDLGYDNVEQYRHILDVALERRAFFSSEIDTLPLLERAYATALILDRQPPSEARFRTFLTLYKAGALFESFVGTSEFENTFIRLADNGMSSRMLGHSNLAGITTYEVSAFPSFWRNYIPQKFLMMPDYINSMSSQEHMPDLAGPLESRHSEFSLTIQNMRYRFPVAAMDGFSELASDRPWFEVALLSLTLKNARIISSCKEFCSNWSSTAFANSADALPDFDFFIIHKDHYPRFADKLHAVAPNATLIFANEVFYVASSRSSMPLPYAGIHSGNFLSAGQQAKELA